jgi:hypothetical protein
LPGKSTIQIHQMQAARAFVDPCACHHRRLFAEGGGEFHIALLQAYTVTVFEINRGN